jgi:hypothetical protein
MVNRVHCLACGQDVPCPPGQKNPPAHKAGPSGGRICYGPGRSQSGGFAAGIEKQAPGKRRGKKAKGPFKEYGEGVSCGKTVLLRRDGRLTSHGYDKDGFKCGGSGRSPVGGRAVTVSMAKSLSPLVAG